MLNLDKFFVNYTSKRGLILKIYKKLKKLDINKKSVKMGYKYKQNSQNKHLKWLKNI